MKYNGIELEEVTEPQIFTPPKTMIVWDDDENTVERTVCAIVDREGFRVITSNSIWKHCANIPEEATNLATNRELARWLAEGNGEAKVVTNVFIHWTYGELEANKNVDDNVSVRKWSDTEWHEPTREYLVSDDDFYRALPSEQFKEAE